jgi:hypothetical protein
MTDDTNPGTSRADGSATDPEPIRRSIEVEYWVIDEEGRLTEPGNLVDASPGAEREFIAPLLEIKTTPCESTSELRRELYGRLESVLSRADSEGKGLVPLATPLSEETIEDLPHERTKIQDRVIGDTFNCVRHCAGTHIHFEQVPGRAIDQLNTLTALDPALALVNSSPYFRNRYLAAGARSKIYRWLAYESVPHQGQLWPYAADTEEWAQRLQRRYEEFVTEAVIAGFDRETVESCFEPESAVWTPVKLREEFSTVEWRSPDTALPSQVVRLADQMAGVVTELPGTEVRIDGKTGDVTDEAVVLPKFDTVQEYVEAAIRWGLSSTAVRSYLDRMGFDVSAFEPLTVEVGNREELTVSDVRQLRLEYADRLETDLARARSISAD